MKTLALASLAQPRPTIEEPATRACDLVAARPEVRDALAASASRHEHLCPRQVLGVRIGFAGLAALGLPAGQTGKRLLIFVESDGCFVDGVEAATGCSMGHRTMRLEDYGRVAATLVDVNTMAAVRVAPAPRIRLRAGDYDPLEHRRYYAQLHGYQLMPDSELLTVVPVTVNYDIAAILGRKGTRVDCAVCGEEVINQREVRVAGNPTCVPCAQGAYYLQGI